jgi:DNA (cytosine-5)-methyltransferase 3A
MSCGQLALQKLGIKVKAYYSAEIDKYAIKVTQHNFPNTIQLGDVTKVFAKDLPKIDLLIGGSPCQGFSFAGKQLAFNDPRSKLFFEFVRLKNECKPTYFMLENVKMKKEFETIISRYMGVAPIEINSALLSAQNRRRLYWTNIGNKPYGLFGDMKCMIPQPKDKGILLRDILESDVQDKYYLSKGMLQYFSKRAANFNQGKVNLREKEGKASCLTSSMASCDISDNFIKVNTILRKAANQKKANCLTAGGSSGGLHSDMTLIVASRGRNPENPNSREAGLYTEQMLEPRYDGKTNCLTSVKKDNLVMHIPEATRKGFIEVKPGECFDFENPKSETRRGRKMQNKSNCLMAKETDFMQFTKDGKIRRLTPIECERLQTVPDEYTSIVSDTQRYRMLGNAWTVDVIAYIFSFMAFEKSKSEEMKNVIGV